MMVELHKLAAATLGARKDEHVGVEESFEVDEAKRPVAHTLEVFLTVNPSSCPPVEHRRQRLAATIKVGAGESTEAWKNARKVALVDELRAKLLKHQQDAGDRATLERLGIKAPSVEAAPPATAPEEASDG